MSLPASATSTATKPRPTLNPALRPFWAQRARNRVLYGGRSSSKSWDAAGRAIYFADNAKLRILCVRQFQNKISESVYTLLKIQIERFGLSHRFDIQRDKIINTATGTEFLFYGLWRSIDEIKSLEAIDILWIEEAHNLTEAQWEVLEPTIRKEHSEVWVVFNPRLVTDFVYKRFVTNPPPQTVVRKINYDENPFLSSTMLRLIEAKRAEDEEDFNHIYLGQPKTDDDTSIIRRSWVLAALDAHKALGITPAGSMRLGFDVADAGEDACAYISAHGSLATGADQWKAGEDELLKSCTHVWSRARELGARVTYDAIGVGASCGAKFNELNAAQGVEVEHDKFVAGGAVLKPDAFYGDTRIKNRDFFANVKAQAWWLVADRFRNTYNAVKRGEKFDDADLIFIDSALPRLDILIDELTTPRREYDAAGRVMVESKKQLSKRDVASPNLADAFIMAFLPGEMRKRSFFG